MSIPVTPDRRFRGDDLPRHAPASVALRRTRQTQVGGTTVTMTGDGAGDVLIITDVGGFLRHNRFADGNPGFASEQDFDTATAGVQPIMSFMGVVSIDAGGGDDTIAIAAGVTYSAVDGGAGADTIDYVAFATSVSANLGLGTTGLAAGRSANLQEVPPTTSLASGTVTISNYNILTIPSTSTSPSPGYRPPTSLAFTFIAARWG